MRVCIPSPYPGGPDTPITKPFEQADMLDYYELSSAGSFEQIAQTRNCIGACIDPVEAIMRRGVEIVIVAGISDSYLMRFKTAGVRVFMASSSDARQLLQDAIHNRLAEAKRETK